VDETFEVQLDTGSEDLDRSLAWQASWATFPNTPLPEPMTATEFDALTAAESNGSTADRGGEWVEQRYPCEPTEVVLAPGGSTSITKSLVAGAIGLPPGPGAVSTFTSVDGQPLEVAVPIEIPSAPVGVVTRAEAIELAVNDPEVSALLSRLPPLEPPGITEGTAVPSHSGPDDPPTPLPEPPTPEPQERSGVVLEATSQGWSLGYARTDATFVATVDPTGAVTVDVRP
jgi:hypothetical protein